MLSLLTPNADINASQDAEGSIILTSTGDWTVARLHDLATKLLSLLDHYNNQTVQWDIANIGEIDSAGMMLFLHYHDLLIANNCNVTIIGATANNLRLSQLLRGHIDKKLAVNTKKERPRLFEPLYKLGKLTSEFFHELMLLFSFFGETTTVFIKSLRHPSSIRYGEIIKNIK
jgi:phospholipid/cholesterol/gamma-HCH transport system permease protein